MHQSHDAGYQVITPESFKPLRCMMFPSILQGRSVFDRLKLLKSKGVKLQIAVNAPQTSARDTAELAATGTS